MSIQRIFFRQESRFIFYLVILLSLVFTSGHAKGVVYSPGDSIEAEVLYVIDGDSIMVKGNRQKIEIRLWGIDAPEYDQPYAGSAKENLAALVDKAKINIEVKDIDKYGRVVAIVRKGRAIINEEMVIKGYAWVHVRYCLTTPCDRWFAIQEAASSVKRGLWRDNMPVAPWKWKARDKFKAGGSTRR